MSKADMVVSVDRDRLDAELDDIEIAAPAELLGGLDAWRVSPVAP